MILILLTSLVCYGLSLMTESVWPSIEILASILSPGLTLFEPWCHREVRDATLCQLDLS